MNNNNPPHPAPQYYPDDEISLIDLWNTLMRRKFVIIGTLIAVMLAAVIYLMMAPRVYEASTRLLLPWQSDLILVEYEHPLTTFKSEEIFDEFSEFILQVRSWRRFVEEHADLFPPQSDLSRIGRNHPIETGQDKDVSFEHLDLTYEADDPERVAAILDNYLRFSEERYIDELVEETATRLEQRKRTLAKEINDLQKKARLERKDNIEKLKENIFLAEKAGIKENIFTRQQRSGTGSDTTILSIKDMYKEYMRGSRALSAELEALLKRESDDPFIGGLRNKQVELEELSSLTLQPDNFHPYRSDGEILAPLRPVKPKPKLVIALSIVLGLMLGVFAAFFTEFIARARDEQ